jgi:acyl-CoA synthetase (AMP-forming)/AMP-acid ligase II
VLYAHPAILEAVAVGVPDATWGETVHAVVVLREGQQASIDSILLWCREKLPSNKRPRSVELVSGAAQNTYGKILRS